MSNLEKDLLELFDLKKEKAETEKRLNLEVMEAQKDIKLLTIMFSDGVPDLMIPMEENEKLIWNADAKKLLFSFNNSVQPLESSGKLVIVKTRPHLRQLVLRAKELITK